MKNVIIYGLAFLVVLVSCKEEKELIPVEVEVENFEFSIDQSISKGDVIGTVKAITNQESVSYVIKTQQLIDALILEELSGELIVNNRSKLNFSEDSQFTLIVTAISGDVTEDFEVKINLAESVMDLITSIEENPRNGTEIGYVEVNQNLKDPLFSIISESHIGAISVDASSGLITVQDSSFFDYEYTTSISCVIEVSFGAFSDNASVQINLDDVVTIVETEDFDKVLETPLLFDGQSLGMIKANIQDGNPHFSIYQEYKDGAFGINQTTGELFALNINQSDFDNNTVLNCTIWIESEGVVKESTVSIIYARLQGKWLSLDHFWEPNCDGTYSPVEVNITLIEAGVYLVSDITDLYYGGSPCTPASICGILIDDWSYVTIDNTGYDVSDCNEGITVSGAGDILPQTLSIALRLDVTNSATGLQEIWLEKEL